MVDFKTLYQLQAPEEERLFEEAVARAQAGDEEARAHLSRSRGEAAQTGGAISMTGSYSDYVQAQRRAQEAWLNATRSDSAVGAALRQNRDAEGMARGAAEETDARRGNLSEWASTDYAQSQKEVKARKEWEAAQAAEAAQREAREGEAFSNFNADLERRMREAWAGLDRTAGDYGQNFNPFNAGGTRALTYEWGNPFTVAGRGNMTPDQQMAWGGKRPGGYAAEDWERMMQYARAQGMGQQADRFGSEARYEWGKRKQGGY